MDLAVKLTYGELGSSNAVASDDHGEVGPKIKILPWQELAGIGCARDTYHGTSVGCTANASGVLFYPGAM